ncbi:TlpA family protein disulfide reductase [Undibacterium jejuense]|uniref:TlpA family protein disulfide reductase n=1 Tax=Undibacterium jejuense TaxID=1344949 RepID=A0A923KRD5_9BURK|nr:TlpA disulfide reductase family protein [Undibacterium jejuense]MBC3863924.1 TlpA family protein disulfide reductase [Undibacterium jejuense]
MLEPSSPRKFRLFAIVAAAALIVLGVLFYQSLSGKTTIPDVTFTNLKGEKISAQSLRGKVVMVNFWATSCSTCVAEMPKMISTYNQYHNQGLEYVAVAMSYDPANYVLNYAETRQLPFQVALDVDGKLAQAFGEVKMTPTTFVIDKQGNILKRYLGEPSFDELHGILEKALKA